MRAAAQRRRRGFTLIELGIVIFLFAVVAAVAVPSVDALTSAKLRSHTTQLAGLIREAYARAAITGKVHRIVLDLDSGAYWLERTEERFVLPSERIEADAQGRGGISLDERAEAAKKGVEMRVQALTQGQEASGDALSMLGIGGMDPGALGVLGGMAGGLMTSTLTSGLSLDEDLEETLKTRLRRQVSFAPATGEPGTPQKLEGDVHFLRVWTEHQEDPFLAGSAELYFFPTGFTERAIITLADDDLGESSLSIVVNPLTARVKILDEEPEVPR